MVRNGKTLLSPIDPVRRSERTADAVSLQDKTLYFCPSPIYGYGLERLLCRIKAEAPNSAVLCIEADNELYETALENISALSAEYKNLRLTNIIDKEDLCVFVRDAWGELAFRRIEMVRLSGGWQLFPQTYDSLCEILRKRIAAGWGNVLTMAKMGRLYIRNFLRNLTLLPHFSSIAELSFGDDPVLVLGAGPSLDNVLDAVKNINKSFRIVCVDTCIGALKDRDIVPDLVVILESQHWNLRGFIGCRGWDVPFAVDLSALPASSRILGLGTGDSPLASSFIFFTPWTHLRIFDRLANAGLLPAAVPPLGSVGLAAVETARRLTSGKIICAGLDFSFFPDKFHARGTPGHRGALNRHTRLCAAAGTPAYEASSAAVSKSGGAVRSNFALRNYRSLFEQEFSGDARLFDIEGSGLPLGVQTLSLDDFLLALDSEEARAEAQGTQREEGGLRDFGKREKLALFVSEERGRLMELRDILTGVAAADQLRLEVLINECDYLWAHFPDCSRGNVDFLDISFLKRIRMEIDPALSLLGYPLDNC